MFVVSQGIPVMKNKSPKNFDVQIKPHEALFIISVVSEMVNLPVWTLRKLDQLDVVKPKRIGKKARCYSIQQIKKLNYISYLMQEKRVSISSVKVFIELHYSE